MNETLNRRLTLLSMALGGISLVLLARLLWFQFSMDPGVKQALEENNENRLYQKVELRPTRGLIYDRNGHLLATNSFEYRVGISPNQVVDRQEVAAQLAPLVGMAEDELYHALEPDDDGEFSPYVLLAGRVDFASGQEIADLDIDGIKIDPLPTRIYPQGELMSQIVGIFAEDDRTKDYRGYYGVEGFYQTILAGQSRRVTTSTVPLLEESQVQAGHVRDGISLVLTIDRDLQFLAQDVLTEAIENDPAATGGTILIMNPRTGEILAMANYPPFNPDEAGPDNLKRARNPAVSEIFEPGSIFKVSPWRWPLTRAPTISTGPITTPAAAEMAAVSICNWDRVSHGNPDFAQVFIQSLNTGTATIYKQMGPDIVYPRLREFGIGSPTGCGSGRRVGGYPDRAGRSQLERGAVPQQQLRAGCGGDAAANAERRQRHRQRRPDHAAAHRQGAHRRRRDHRDAPLRQPPPDQRRNRPHRPRYYGADRAGEPG